MMLSVQGAKINRHAPVKQMEKIKNTSIKGFVETSFVDWPGKICSVIFFSGCNFRCCYCHNADLVLRPEALADIDFESIIRRLSDLKGWIDAVCVSGGEPTLHSFLPAVLSDLKKEGFLTKLDTNGSSPEVLRGLIQDGLVDYVAMDVKSSLNEINYCKVTHVPHMLEAVKKSIRLLLEGRVQYEFRSTVLPSHHGLDDIYKLAMELNGAARLRIQNFNPSSPLDPGLKSLKPYSDRDIDLIQQRVDKLIAV